MSRKKLLGSRSSSEHRGNQKPKRQLVLPLRKQHVFKKKQKTFIIKLIYGSYLCRYSFAVKITFTSNSLWDIDYTFPHCSRLPVNQSFPLERLHCSCQTGSCQLLDPLSPSTRMCFQTHYMLDGTPCRMSLKDSFL